jgi:glycosyltransferase involved in cell wall biosynthesis
MERNKPNKLATLKISDFYLGANIDQSIPTIGLPQIGVDVVDLIGSKRSFLQVSTLAPHKGHSQVLDAFELLWKADADVNLIIVGKQGWLVEPLVQRLRNHPELNRHLFWLEGISDEYLEKVYASSTCLIASSYGEGFGLPLIEAAQHKLPIIARDIPVFREVAGEHAYYFKADQPADLARAIESWLTMHKKGEHPKSVNMPWLTWKESAAQLLHALNLPEPIESTPNEVKVNH